MNEGVGKRLRQLRKEAGYDGHGGQKQFAEAAGLPQSTISDIENGRIGIPGGEKLAKLARALRVHPDALVSAGGESVKSTQPSPEEADLLGIYSQLEPANRAALFAAARAMLNSQGEDDPGQRRETHYIPHGRRHS